MRVFLLLIVVHIFSELVLSQNYHTIDSLNKEIKKIENICPNPCFSDTGKINAYLLIAEEYIFGNPDSALIFNQKAKDISEILIESKELSGTVVNTAKKYLSSILNNIGNIIENQGDLSKGMEYYQKSYTLSESINYKAGLAMALGNIAANYDKQGDVTKGIEYFNKCIILQEELNDKIGLAQSYNNIGYVYNVQGDIPKSLDYFLKGLKLQDEIGDELGMSYSLNNIGYIYDIQGDLEKAFEYYSKSLSISEKLGDKSGLGYSLNNVGFIYDTKKDYEKAIEFYKRSISVFEEIDEKSGLAYAINNIGAAYVSLGNIEKAKECYEASYKIREEIDDKYGMAHSLYNLGLISKKQKNISQLKLYATKGYELSKKLAYPDRIESAAYLMKHLSLIEKDYKKAFEYYEEEVKMHDSILNKDNYKKTQKLQARYEFQRKMAVDSTAHVKAIQIKDLELAKTQKEKEKQRVIIYSFVFGFIIILFFSIIIFRLFLQKRKANYILAQQKEEIEAQRDEIETQRDVVMEQKHHIEEIHQEVTDSINYAKRIQEAVLPISKASRSILGEHFILFRPKDIVSGDFYWTAKIENTLIISVADCTGHGVPGAFMSMLGISFLNEIIRKKEILKASEALNELRKEIINALQQKGSEGEQKDGMDISLIAIDTISNKAQWAGANNPLWVVKSSTLKDTNLKTQENSSLNLDTSTSLSAGLETCFLELKADKMPIAIYEKMESFTNHELQFQDGDIIYLMSDGYQDQFGGPKHKKFLSKNLKQLLLENSQKPMEEQREILEKTLLDWIGDGEQIDDITVIGIKI